MKLWLKHEIVDLQNGLTLWAVLGTKYFKKPTKNYLRLGTTWGGWWIDSQFLNNSAEKTLISAGLGGDVSFEKELSTSNFNVIGVDPDPECHKFLEENNSSFFFNTKYVAALSDLSGMKTLLKSSEGSFDSWTDSKISGQRTISKEFHSIGINDLYQQLEIFRKFESTYLKMDIEGGELEVLRSIINERLKFAYLSVEFDFLSLIRATALIPRFKKIFEARKLLNELESLNYIFLFNDGFNFYWRLEQ